MTEVSCTITNAKNVFVVTIFILNCKISFLACLKTVKELHCSLSFFPACSGCFFEVTDGHTVLSSCSLPRGYKSFFLLLPEGSCFVGPQDQAATILVPQSGQLRLSQTTKYLTSGSAQNKIRIGFICQVCAHKQGI
ncbi:hypothetical protein XENOCAPTIV_012805 [Xenoophorus captivus]|uniref:Uncharacterized protein n=1 Tax=Xenoophorus captivus TaxID=1517983 RepID=A0ABV0Q4Z8_9TELE